MNEKHVNRELSAGADDRLSQLLAEWALRVRLSQQEENELYDRIFVMTDDLGYDWWRQLIGGHFVSDGRLLYGFRHSTRGYLDQASSFMDRGFFIY